VAVDRSYTEQRAFDLKLVTEQIVASVRPGLPKARRNAISIDIPPDITLDSYPGAYGQVLTNLIFNAVIHGFADRPDGQALIKARRIGPEQIEITFSDNGSGIPGDIQRKIFDPFFTTRRAEGSTGLGLYIVYNIVTQQFGGTIVLSSMPGNGTVFRITLPLHPPAQAAGTS
jgi:signal transduction histidine kinase